MNKKEIDDEFFRIAEQIRGQGDIDCLLDLIPLAVKKRFIEDYKR